jgi:tetratricopeptide (TPR) repeat protein
MMQDVLEQNPKMDGIRPLIAVFLAHQGRHDEARAQLTQEAIGLAKADHDMAYWLATAYSQLGEKDLAFKWLERAIKLGNENRPFFEVDKNLEPIRHDPRFDELMSKIEKEHSQGSL